MAEVCIQCSKNQATVRAEWQVGEKPQRAELCQVCCEELWRKFGRTTNFIFSEPYEWLVS